MKKYLVKFNSKSPCNSEVFSPTGEKLPRVVGMKIEVDPNVSTPLLYLTIAGVEIKEMEEVNG